MLRIHFVISRISSFLILIGRFVTLEGMKIKSVTPNHRCAAGTADLAQAIG